MKRSVRHPKHQQQQVSVYCHSLSTPKRTRYTRFERIGTRIHSLRIITPVHTSSSSSSWIRTLAPVLNRQRQTHVSTSHTSSYLSTFSRILVHTRSPSEQCTQSTVHLEPRHCLHTRAMALNPPARAHRQSRPISLVTRTRQLSD